MAHLGSIFNRKLTEELVSSYCIALKTYTDEEISVGFEQAMTECEKFPTPKEIISRVSIQKKQTSLNYPLFGKKLCVVCEQVKYCMKETENSKWECRECYTGMNTKEIKEKLEKIRDSMGSQKESAAARKKREAQEEFEQKYDKKEVRIITPVEEVNRKTDLLKQYAELKGANFLDDDIQF